MSCLSLLTICVRVVIRVVMFIYLFALFRKTCLLTFSFTMEFTIYYGMTRHRILTIEPEYQMAYLHLSHTKRIK